MRKFELHAKTFLLGEYLALSGGPAILYLTPPPFILQESQVLKEDLFHPESPAGKYFLATESIRQKSFEWINPYTARGGFGASSAEFAGLFLFANQEKINVLPNEELAWRARDEFLGLHKDAKVKPSGLDVVAQVYSALVSPITTLLLYVDANTKELLELPKPNGRNARIELLHTGRKLATHEHLESLNKSIPIAAATRIVKAARSGLEKNILGEFFAAIEDYQALLEESGLVAPFTTELLKELTITPNVLAAKGCGALGSDVIACVQSPHAPHFRQAIFSELW